MGVILTATAGLCLWIIIWATVCSAASTESSWPAS